MKEIDKWIDNSERFGKPGLINLTICYQQPKRLKNEQSTI